MSSVATYRNDGKYCYCQIKFDSGERVLISIATRPTPSVKVVRLALGVNPRETIWEYNPTMAGGYNAYVQKLMVMFQPTTDESDPLNIIRDVLLDCESISEAREALLEHEARATTVAEPPFERPLQHDAKSDSVQLPLQQLDPQKEAIVSCPGCGARLRVPNVRGQVRCPKCTTILAQEPTDIQSTRLELEPYDAEGHYNLASAYFETNQRDAAIASLRKAIELKPDYGDAYKGLGRCICHNFRDRIEVDEAIAAFRKSIQLKHDDADAHSGLGIALCHRLKEDEAIAPFRKAIELDPEFAEAHWGLGSALLRTDYSLSSKERHQEAISLFRRAIELEPDNFDAYFGLGLALEDDVLPEAIASFHKAVELDPDNELAHVYLGRVLRKAGLEKEADQEFKEAERLKPKRRTNGQ